MKMGLEILMVNWIGLRSMHCLTSQGNWELQIDYKLKNGTESYLHYNKFAIGSAEDQYPLNILGFDSIELTDSFYTYPINEMKFTSCDRDNDLGSGYNCAHYNGGWWHDQCTHIHLNGNGDNMPVRLNGQWQYPIFVEMKIRKQNCDIN